ncbi:MAG: hypothetical protein WD425_14550 [Nitrospirales bacterium]
MAEGRARDVPTQPFEGVPLLGAAPGVRMQAKPLGTHTALGMRHLVTGQAQRGVFPRHAHTLYPLKTTFFLYQRAEKTLLSASFEKL